MFWLVCCWYLFYCILSPWFRISAPTVSIILEWTGRLRQQQKGVLLQPAFSDNLLLFSKEIKLKDIVGPDLENLRSTRNVPDLQCQPEHLHFLTYSFQWKLLVESQSAWGKSCIFSLTRFYFLVVYTKVQVFVFYFPHSKPLMFGMVFSWIDFHCFQVDLFCFFFCFPHLLTSPHTYK